MDMDFNKNPVGKCATIQAGISIYPAWFLKEMENMHFTFIVGGILRLEIFAEIDFKPKKNPAGKFEHCHFYVISKV